MSRSRTARFEHAPQAGAGALARIRHELAVANVSGAREVRPGGEHAAERLEVDRSGRPAERLDELRDLAQAGG